MIWDRTISGQERNSTEKWNHVKFLAGGFSLFLDALFLYVPTVVSPRSVDMDWRLGSIIAVPRSVADLIFLCSMILKFQAASKPQAFHNVYKGEEHFKKSKYKWSSFIVDLVAILPLPQVIVVLKKLESDGLALSVFAQLPFRALAMSPVPKGKVTPISMLAKNAWSGALQNLVYFIMISNGVGAVYYNEYISRLISCRNGIDATESDATSLNWDELISRCTQTYDNFANGIISDALSTKIGTRSFLQKYTYCLAWGLKSLSSFGQIFNASSFAVDTFYSFLIIVFGLILFGDLLARMQTGLQCTEQKEDRQRARQRMVEEWMKHHQLPPHLKKHVKQAIQSEWSATRGINDDAILETLPWHIRCEIRRHLYLEIIKTMPQFADMDNQLANTLCGYLRTSSFNEGSYIVFVGEPVREMLFIFNGQLEVSTANSSGQPTTLGPGDICGKELLEWCSHPTTSTENLRPSTQTAKCLSNVDAFSLRADDVKLLAIQFHHNGKFRRVFQQYAA